jgi:hypothetical protein
MIRRCRRRRMACNWLNNAADAHATTNDHRDDTKGTLLYFTALNMSLWQGR